MRSLCCKLITGFVLSVIITLLAYILVVEQYLQGHALFMTVMSLAFLQAFIQLILFLHLGEEETPKWKLMTFWFMLTVLVIVVAGTVWIMYHLNYNVMPNM